MELNKKLLKIVDDQLKKRVFVIHDSIISGTSLKTDIKFKAEVLGIREFRHIGTPHDNLVFEITIIDADDMSKHILGLLEERLKNNPEDEFWGFCLSLKHEIYDKLLHVFELTWLHVSSIVLNFNTEKPQITEGKQSRLFVRNAVRYITNLLKNKKNGSFYDYYDELNQEIGDIGFEVHLNHSKKPGFIIDAEYSPEDDSVSIFIDYNPDTVEKNLYEIIGELNEDIEHEITHAKQQSHYDLPTKEPKTRYKYYTQPHEIEAQKKGFIRLSKLRKLPLDIVVKTWFDTHKDIHGLTDKQVDKVIKKILEY
jgi:hypothetical protein